MQEAVYNCQAAYAKVTFHVKAKMICSYRSYGNVLAHNLTYCSAVDEIKSGSENWVNHT